MNDLISKDPVIAHLIDREAIRLAQDINLIASENYAPQSILEATGSILTDKYAEGYPGKRYYAGCAVIDDVERHAQDRCKQLFGAEHANVQPHAGSQANLAAYFAVLQPGDTILGMSLAEGGHLTHGHSVNFSGTVYKAVQYTVDKDTEQLDYDQIEALAEQHKPKLIIAGASAYSRTIDFDRFASIARKVGSYFMADIAHIAGPIAAGLHPSPVNSADIVTSTTHKTLRGPRGGFILSKQSLAQQIDRAIMPGTQGGPCMHVIAAKAVAFKLALEPDFILYQRQILANAKAMAQVFKDMGYRIVTGGTDNHLFVLDLRSKNLNGLLAQQALAKSGIIVSRSCVPFDTEKPYITSGIRLGTPAITSRGMCLEQAEEIAVLINDVLKNHDNEQMIAWCKERARKLTAQFPIIR